MPPRWRNWFLLIASYLFYMNWLPAYGRLIFCLTVINYHLGLAIAGAVKRRRLILILGLCFNIGALCFYKYAAFLVDNVCSMTHLSNNFLRGIFPQVSAINWSEPTVNIILPLGISFFTFEFIHYIVDVYKGYVPMRNFKDFALFAAFFPTQIAGPIKRYQDFWKQLKEPHVLNIFAPNQVDFGGGIFLILQGLYKKIVLGDNLAGLVNYAFSHTSQLGAIDAWIAAAGFTFQIFFDFSGYTDIGRGSAMLLGYKVPENFNWPYLAANLTDFWRRWHMSLSTWLRDYLFIPLGGSRGSSWMVRRNLLITMMLGGLWHGAAWHYIIWGAFHGLGLIISKDWSEFVSKYNLLSSWRATKVWHCFGVVYTVLFIFVASILFRADNLKDVWLVCRSMIGFSPAANQHDLTEMFCQSTVPISLFAYCLFLGWRLLVRKLTEAQIDPSAINNYSRVLTNLKIYWQNSLSMRLAVCASIALIILGFSPGKITPFIYFQF